MNVNDIIQAKPGTLFSVQGQLSVYEALKIMGENNIGALPVIESGKLMGIISERDYARKIILKGKSSRTTLVNEIMTEKVLTVSPGDNIDLCMSLMSENRIRHLPVIQDETVIGMISIGDVVNAVIQSQKDTIDHLQTYISQ